VTRRALVAAVVLLAGFAAATVRVGDAEAYVDPPHWLSNPATQEANWSTVDGWLRGPSTPPQLTTATANPSRWSRVKLAGKYGWGGLGASAGFTMPTVAVVAGGALFGWEIGHSSGLSDWASGKLLGLGQPTPVAAITGQQWVSAGPFTAADWNGDIIADGVPGSPQVVYQLRVTGSSGGCPVGQYAEPWISDYGLTYSGCNAANNAAMKTALDGAVATAPGAIRAEGYCNAPNTPAHNCVAYFMPVDTLLGRANVDELRPYNATTDAPNKTATITGVPRPTTTGNDTTRAQDTVDAIKADPQLNAEIGAILDPAGAPGGAVSGEVIALPQPRYGETAGSYRTRLRSRGFLGTVILEALDPLDALVEFGPNVVTRVTVTTELGTSTFELLDPWPEPPVTFRVPGESTSIVVEHNPSGVDPPVPGAPGSPADPPPGVLVPPGEGDDVDGCPCPIDSIELRSLAPEGLCGKAPFGAFCWIEDQVSTLFGGPATAPSFTFDPGAIETELVTIPADTFDLELDLANTPEPILDAFALVRVVLGFAVWLIGCWMLGRKLLGTSAPDATGVDPEWDASAGSYGGNYR
jgi:hypothetical protein